MVRSGPRWYTTVAIVVAVVGTFVVSLVVYAYLSSDAHDAMTFDDDAVWAAASTGCVGVTLALQVAAANRIERVSLGNAAIGRLVDGMYALGVSTLADEPAIEWTRDWERLAAARSEFGARLRSDAGAVFLEPEVAGHPISERLVGVAPEECDAAIALATEP